MIAEAASRAAAASESFAAFRANNAWERKKEKEKERERVWERGGAKQTVLGAVGRCKPLAQPHTILHTLLRLEPPGRRCTGKKQQTDIVPRT